MTNSQLDTTNESQEVSPFPVGDHKAHINRRTQRHSKHKTVNTKISTKEVPPWNVVWFPPLDLPIQLRIETITGHQFTLERSVKYFTGGLKPVKRRQPHHITYALGPSINRLVTDGNTKLCCRDSVLVLFQSTTANKIDFEHTHYYMKLFWVCKVEILQVTVYKN